MNVSNKTKIFVGIAAAIFIVAVICLLVFGGKDKDKQPTDESTTPVISSQEYDISGTWYSDREKGDMLTLDKTGTYTSSVWLADGQYVCDGNNITLTDVFGDKKELTLNKADNTYTLQYAGTSAHTYYRTQAEADKAAADAAQEQEDMQGLYNAALTQILTTGDWESLDKTTIMTFTDSDITFEYAGVTVGNSNNVGAATTTYSYSVSSFTVENGNYFVVMDFHDKTNNADYKGCNVDISVGEDNLYTVLCHNFPYAYKYSKTVEITFTQPEQPTGSVTQEDIAAANRTGTSTGTAGSTGDRVKVNEDGSVDNITQLSRDDNPDDAAQIEAAYKEIEAAIYGTWKGTFDDFVNANTVYWQFVLNKDGTYSFNDAAGYTETGTFTIGRNADNAAYFSNITLTPKDAAAYVLNFTMTGNPLNKLRFDSYSLERSYPTFKK